MTCEKSKNRLYNGGAEVQIIVHRLVFFYQINTFGILNPANIFSVSYTKNFKVYFSIYTSSFVNDKSIIFITYFN